MSSESQPEAHLTEELSSNLYCFAKEDIDNEIHPLPYKQIGQAQSKDKVKAKDPKYYL